MKAYLSYERTSLKVGFGFVLGFSDRCALLVALLVVLNVPVIFGREIKVMVLVTLA